jgi:GxxExxY protein
MFTGEIESKCDSLSNIIIGCAIEVHKNLGPGLIESAYESSLCCELTKAGVYYQRQPELLLIYKDIKIPNACRLDILVEDLVIIELKAVDEIPNIFRTKLKTYLKLSQKWLGLSLNFNVVLMKDGIERIVWGQVNKGVKNFVYFVSLC